MNVGDVVLIRLSQVSGAAKLRPAVVLSLLPGSYQNVLLAGISTQTQNIVAGWDDSIATDDRDFHGSGLHHDPIVRLSFLYAANASEILGAIGTLEPSRIKVLQSRLAQHLVT